MSARTFLLTGCASGIGQHLSTVLCAAGHRVLMTDINEHALLRHAAALGRPESVRARRLDVRDAVAWQEAVAVCEEQMGGLDVLVNVAGYLRPGYVHTVPLQEIDLHFDINTRGVVLGTRAAAAVMVPRRRGHIINIGSLASLAPVPGLSLYSGAKFAVRGFSLSAAQELRPHGVYVTVVCPDAVQTPMLDLQIAYPEAAMTFSGARALTVDEIADAITGTVLRDRPTEVVLPRGRGALAKLAGLAPGLALRLTPLFLRVGLRRQATLRREGKT